MECLAFDFCVVNEMSWFTPEKSLIFMNCQYKINVIVNLLQLIMSVILKTITVKIKCLNNLLRIQLISIVNIL